MKRAAFLIMFLLASVAFGAGLSRASESGGQSVVVLDAGHGGSDLGAVGPGGMLEKNITLNVAKRLAGLLKKNGDFKALLTRDSDVFMPLNERTEFANRNNADIFISIHANATVSRDINGLETFFLSFEASDADAMRAAELENSFGLEQMKPAEQDDLSAILMDMLQTASHHESSKLAELVQSSMVGALKREDRGVKQAPFLVLAGAAMPAVLVEIGFISNPAEEALISKDDWQDRIAHSIYDGITSFRKERRIERAGYDD